MNHIEAIKHYEAALLEAFPRGATGDVFEHWNNARKAIAEAEKQEPMAWRTFDGEGGYDYRSFDDNENYADEWSKRNPNHKGWVEPLYTHPQPKREPLTDDEIVDTFCKAPHQTQHVAWFAAGVRYAEAAHGIKEKNNQKGESN